MQLFKPCCGYFEHIKKYNSMVKLRSTQMHCLFLERTFINIKFILSTDRVYMGSLHYIDVLHILFTNQMVPPNSVKAPIYVQINYLCKLSESNSFYYCDTLGRKEKKNRLKGHCVGAAVHVGFTSQWGYSCSEFLCGRLQAISLQLKIIIKARKTLDQGNRFVCAWCTEFQN